MYFEEPTPFLALTRVAVALAGTAGATRAAGGVEGRPIGAADVGTDRGLGTAPVDLVAVPTEVAVREGLVRAGEVVATGRVEGLRDGDDTGDDDGERGAGLGVTRTGELAGGTGATPAVGWNLSCTANTAHSTTVMAPNAEARSNFRRPTMTFLTGPRVDLKDTGLIGGRPIDVIRSGGSYLTTGATTSLYVARYAW